MHESLLKIWWRFSYAKTWHVMTPSNQNTFDKVTPSRKLKKDIKSHIVLNEAWPKMGTCTPKVVSPISRAQHGSTAWNPNWEDCGILKQLGACSHCLRRLNSNLLPTSKRSQEVDVYRIWKKQFKKLSSHSYSSITETWPHHHFFAHRKILFQPIKLEAHNQRKPGDDGTIRMFEFRSLGGRITCSVGHCQSLAMASTYPMLNGMPLLQTMLQHWKCQKTSEG